MKLNLKSRKGFTLIELLVVIGILAVLAAIAIPSVAGLIDRANVSADKTNSNEMTNAIERFASEYELYCQDIASGALDPDNLDSAQGRVKNVIGVTTRAGIEGIEKPQSAKANATTGVAIYRDTKYPVNAETMKKVVENYTKTSSSTFEPKQSDMHYWYSPDCGVVVFAEPDADIEADLNSQIQSGQDAKGNDLGPTTQWIDLTLGAALSGGSANIDWSTIDKDNLDKNTWEDIQKVVSNGKIGETNWKVGDVSPSFQCDGNMFTAKLIGIGQDGANTATFMFDSYLGYHVMNNDWTNNGGFAASNMNTWLSGYDSKMSNGNCIISVNKTNNLGYENPTGTSSDSGKLFLLSVKEIGLQDELENDWGYPYMSSINAESSFTYTYFQTDGYNRRAEFANGDWFWLRSADSDYNRGFFGVGDGGYLGSDGADGEDGVVPAFVIG